MVRRGSRTIVVGLVLALLVDVVPGLGQPRRRPVPLSKEENNILMAETLLSLARQAKSGRRFSEARGHLQEITSLAFPGDPEAQELLAGTFLLLAEVNLANRSLGDSERAAWTAIRRSRKKSSVVTAQAYKILARIAETRGNSQEAQRFLRLALQILNELGR